MSPRSFAVLLATALALLSPTAPASAHVARPAARVALPTSSEAQLIVQTLWNRRELALQQADARTIDTFATASAKSHDLTYIKMLRCRCEPSIGLHPLDDVIPQVPKASIRPVFFAQVRTTNAETHNLVWYVVAVERGRSGLWRIAFVSYEGRNEDTPPLFALTQSNDYTPRMTADTYARITAQAKTIVHTEPVQRTTDGVVARGRDTAGTPAEGIYGLALASGKVMSCFTRHIIGTYTYPGGVLVQKAPKNPWGPLIKPGTYESITRDIAVAQCTVGTGATNHHLFVQDAPRDVAASGIRV